MFTELGLFVYLLSHSWSPSDGDVNSCVCVWGAVVVKHRAVISAKGPSVQVSCSE